MAMEFVAELLKLTALAALALVGIVVTLIWKKY